MSNRQLRSTDRAILQIIVKIGYDLRLAEARFLKAKIAWLCDSGPRSAAERLSAYHSSDGKRGAVRETAESTLQICAAMPPARRREAWVAFRSGWRLAGKTLGGAR